MYMLCTKDNIDMICEKLLKHEISKVSIKEIDNAYMLKFSLNENGVKYDKNILAELYSIIREFYTCMLYDKVEVFELNYNLDLKQYNLFKSYDIDEKDQNEYIKTTEKAKDYLRKSLELFESIGVDKLSIETLYTKEKNRYKNISFIEALRELNKYI